MSSDARRVVFLAWAPFFSGAERALVRGLHGLRYTRYEPFVIVGTDGELASQLKAMGVPHQISAIGQVDRRRPIAAVRSIASVFATARRHRASVIHANDVPSFQPGGYAARALGIPALTHVRFPDSGEGYRWFLRSGISRAIFVSEDQRRTAVGQAPDLFDGRSDVLHDCVERQEAWTHEKRTRIRAELGLPPASTLVAITGQVAEVKGIWEYLEAARLLAHRVASAHFVVLGDDLKSNGQVRRELQQRVAAAGLSQRFTFLGFRSDASALVQAFDVVAVPSHVEPFGLAALEASACGCAVVASRVGGLPEIVVDGDTGLLVPPVSSHSLAEAIGRLVEDRDLRVALGERARHRARELFGVEHYGRRLAAMYDRLISAGAAAPGRLNVEPA